jgi:hypothetical protein
MYTGSSGDWRACAISRELRKRGWRTIVVPPWLGLMERRRIIQIENPEFIFLQQSRHPLNRPELYGDVPIIFDVDDADILNNRDLVAECCRGSRAVIAGNRYLAGLFREYNSDVCVIWTGTYVTKNLSHKPFQAVP